MVNSEMEHAIALLTSAMCYEPQEATTHHIITVTCWNDSALNREAVAHYLVGLRICAVDAVLNVRAHLEDTVADQIEVLQSVTALVGESNTDLTDDEKPDDRNPWMAEGIWHLCMVIASRRPEIHPVGRIVALNPLHVSAKDHGLDVAAIYQEDDGLFGLSLIETKAYKNNPNSAINSAVAFFRSVDQGQHTTRIRQAVQTMRTGLERDRQATISESFWKPRRSYLPNPHYDSGHDINWTNPRPSFESLTPDRSNIVIMPHSIQNFDDFFDSIADEMRKFAESLQTCMTSMQEN